MKGILKGSSEVGDQDPQTWVWDTKDDILPLLARVQRREDPATYPILPGELEGPTCSCNALKICQGDSEGGCGGSCVVAVGWWRARPWLQCGRRGASVSHGWWVLVFRRERGRGEGGAFGFLKELPEGSKGEHEKVLKDLQKVQRWTGEV